MLQQRLKKTLSGIKGTYLPILIQVVASEDDGWRERRVLEFKRIVGSLVMLFDPLSVLAFTALIGALPTEVVRVLRLLHSVLNIPKALDGRVDLNTPITLFHLSFRDFLVDSALCLVWGPDLIGTGARVRPLCHATWERTSGYDIQRRIGEAEQLFAIAESPTPKFEI